MDINERLTQIENTLSALKERVEMSIQLMQKVVASSQRTMIRPDNKLPDHVIQEAVKPPLDAPKVVEPPKPKVEAPKHVEPPKEVPMEVVRKPLLQQNAQPTTPTPKQQPLAQIVPNADKKPPIELVNLLNSKEWPHAVDPTLICDISSEQDKEDRAEGILDLIIDVHLENLKFLDFGCGEGHVINKSRTQKPKIAVGYDLTKNEKWDQWEKSPNIYFTNNWSDVKNFGLFNIVLMYDVIDHMLGDQEEVVNQLREIKKLLAPNAKIYVRTHPWCSRHGTHLYHQINKAYVHMVFSDEEIAAMGYKQEQTRKHMHPLYDYSTLFTAAGLKVLNEPHQIREGVEPFFVNNPLIAGRIKDNYKSSPREEFRKGKFPTVPLENQFIDYVLG